MEGNTTSMSIVVVDMKVAGRRIMATTGETMTATEAEEIGAELRNSFGQKQA